MQSLYEELSARIASEPRAAGRGGARADLGILLFGNREAVNVLWKAADAAVRAPGRDAAEDLKAAVERLRSLFGPRG